MGILFSCIKSLNHCSVCQFYSFLDEFLFLGMIWVSENMDNPISRESHYYGHWFKGEEWVESEKTRLTLLIHAFHRVPIWSSTFLLWAKQVDYSLHCIPDQLLQEKWISNLTVGSHHCSQRAFYNTLLSQIHSFNCYSYFDQYSYQNDCDCQAY